MAYIWDVGNGCAAPGIPEIVGLFLVVMVAVMTPLAACCLMGNDACCRGNKRRRRQQEASGEGHSSFPLSPLSEHRNPMLMLGWRGNSPAARSPKSPKRPLDVDRDAGGAHDLEVSELAHACSRTEFPSPQLWGRIQDAFLKLALENEELKRTRVGASPMRVRQGPGGGGVKAGGQDRDRSRPLPQAAAKPVDDGAGMAKPSSRSSSPKRRPRHLPVRSPFGARDDGPHHGSGSPESLSPVRRGVSVLTIDFDDNASPPTTSNLTFEDAPVSAVDGPRAESTSPVPSGTSSASRARFRGLPSHLQTDHQPGENPSHLLDSPRGSRRSFPALNARSYRAPEFSRWQQRARSGRRTAAGMKGNSDHDGPQRNPLA